MSMLSDFINSNHSTAKGIIGAKSFAIGSLDSVDVVPAEARHERASELNGFQKSSSLTVVASVSDFRAVYDSDVNTYLGKNCTHDGDPWRVGDIEEGESFITLSLVSREEVS